MNLGHSRGSRMTLSPTIVAYICTSVRLIKAAPILAMATRVDATANAIVARRRASTNRRPMRGVGMLQACARHCSGDWYTTVPSPVHRPVGRRCAEAEHQQRDPRECDVSQNSTGHVSAQERPPRGLTGRMNAQSAVGVAPVLLYPSLIPGRTTSQRRLTRTMPQLLAYGRTHSEFQLYELPRRYYDRPRWERHEHVAEVHRRSEQGRGRRA